MGRVMSLVLVSLIALCAATAADSDWQRETLRGLKGVQVLVRGCARRALPSNRLGRGSDVTHGIEWTRQGTP